MKRLISTIRTALNKNAATIVAITVSNLLLLYIYGCPSRTLSLTTPGARVTRAELNIELSTILATAEVRFAELDREAAFKNALANAALSYMQTGTITPLSLTATLFAIFGVGVTVDKTRKTVKRAIRNHKNKNNANKTPTGGPSCPSTSS